MLMDFSKDDIINTRYNYEIKNNNGDNLSQLITDNEKIGSK